MPSLASTLGSVPCGKGMFLIAMSQYDIGLSPLFSTALVAAVLMVVNCLVTSLLTVVFISSRRLLVSTFKRSMWLFTAVLMVSATVSSSISPNSQATD